MPIRLYNSLSRSVEPFEPTGGKSVNLFVCGPTVYDRIHLGNARTFTVFDVIAKWLRFRRFEVTYLQNITDIDDKILKRAADAARDPLQYAREFDDAFRADMQALGNTAVSQYARATDHIPQVIAQVHKLISTGNAYLIEGDGWYYDLSTFPDYGKLSGRTGLQADDAVSRIDDSDKKRNTGDFALWKLSKASEPAWEDAKLGAGRPGWHIEDTAITEHYFGPQYDVHGGGMDLKFPHHEAEIAQQEAASGKVPFVKYWMHAGFLQTAEKRMGKSMGNMTTLNAALERWPVPVIRFFLLSAHYRSPLDMTDASMNGAAAAVARIGELLAKLTALEGKEGGGALENLHELALIEMGEAMDDDFNTPKAFGVLFDFIRSINGILSQGGLSAPDTALVRSVFSFASESFGIVPEGGAPFPDDIQALVDERALARDQKDFATSDQLRDRLEELGWTVDDTPYGPLAKIKPRV
jgi:cysteinyl-tRNA synthetase